MNYIQAYSAMTQAILYNKNPLVITPTNSNKQYCQVSCKIFYHKEKDRIYIFANNGDILDCKDLLKDINNLTNQEKTNIHDYDIAIFLDSIHLTGGVESNQPYNECFFGELDSKDSNMGFNTNKPIYYLQGGEDMDSVIARNEMTKQSTNKDSKQSTNNNAKVSNAMDCHEANTSRNDNKESIHTTNTNSTTTQSNSTNNNSNTTSPSPHNNIDSPISTSTLQVFLNNFTLTILNYSILDSSLHIKLECNSKESKEIRKQERDCHEAKASSKENKESISSAFLCPILEDNELKCPHNGRVKLKSNKGKSFKSQGIPMILESDLLNASIVGCTNNIAGVPTPCTLVSVILPSARAYKKYNDDYPIMQDLCVSGVLSDKGFPITCKPKNNTFKINAPNIKQRYCRISSFRI
ncbi:hypothetical protein [Helicobacter didelphidarum]|uniref:hypothetical protein n=1 Tax=Helicobacter didelphidarum TaxID=2040648 RepID=UPI001FE334BD|nr:hypothetical protein [Helicobacter didelphidarum]